MIEPILRVGKKLGDSLYDFCGITPDVQFILAIGARPFPNLVDFIGCRIQPRMGFGLHLEPQRARDRKDVRAGKDLGLHGLA